MEACRLFASEGLECVDVEVGPLWDHLQPLLHFAIAAQMNAWPRLLSPNSAVLYHRLFGPSKQGRHSWNRSPMEEHLQMYLISLTMNLLTTNSTSEVNPPAWCSSSVFLGLNFKTHPMQFWAGVWDLRPAGMRRLACHDSQQLHDRETNVFHSSQVIHCTFPGLLPLPPSFPHSIKEGTCRGSGACLPLSRFFFSFLFLQSSSNCQTEKGYHLVSPCLLHTLPVSAY